MSYYPLTPIYVRYGERKSYTLSINLINKLIYTFMKKLFLSIATLSLMSFTSVTIYKNYIIGESITTIQDMKEWMTQDIENGNIDQELGQTYIDNLEQVENDLIEYVNGK